MYTPTERVEVTTKCPGQMFKRGTNVDFTYEDVKVRLPIHRDILNVRREGYRTRRNMSTRTQSKVLLALRTRQMWRKQRLQKEGSFEIQMRAWREYYQGYGPMPSTLE